MNAYLAIISGAIKLFNYIAGALQQHHDELNGRNAQVVDDQAATIKAAEDARKDDTRVDGLGHDQLVGELRDPSGRNG